MCDYLEEISNNGSKVINIDDSVDSNVEGIHYKFGTKSNVSYQGDPYPC